MLAAYPGLNSLWLCGPFHQPGLSDHAGAGLELQEGGVEHCLQHAGDWRPLWGQDKGPGGGVAYVRQGITSAKGNSTCRFIPPSRKCFEPAILPVFHTWEEQWKAVFISLGCPMQNNLNVEIHLPSTPDSEGVFQQHLPSTPDFQDVFQQQESSGIVITWVVVELDGTLSFLYKITF